MPSTSTEATENDEPSHSSTSSSRCPKSTEENAPPPTTSTTSTAPPLPIPTSSASHPHPPPTSSSVPTSTHTRSHSLPNLTNLTHITATLHTSLCQAVRWAEEKASKLSEEKNDGTGPYSNPATCMPADLDAIASGVLPALPAKRKEGGGGGSGGEGR
ncbi:hypothetical protein M011DRAFT_468124 [Sporormia fimetaria CBS 119925]|uniref:Uncharacterized protein n=1 Tax=Sporormia fimetaria CBS 119925 TaxID=1340428 RepID=A0A6A6V854_9PLEO|nr:hypothetical protein M011DRAFT_468124 [Sporormia fimetaria CBS 119925]